MHRTPAGARFIVTSRKCNIKVLSKAVTKAFKLVLSQIQSFHEKSHFYFVYKKFRVVENSKPVIDRLDQKTLNRMQSLSLLLILVHFTLSSTQRPDKDTMLFDWLILLLMEAQRRKLIFPLKMVFGRISLKQNLFSLKNLVIFNWKFIFYIGNVLLLQTVGIPMGINAAPRWANLYIYNYESK